MGSPLIRKPNKLSAAKTALILLDVISDFEFEDGDILLKQTRTMAPHLFGLYIPTDCVTSVKATHTKQGT